MYSNAWPPTSIDCITLPWGVSTFEWCEILFLICRSESFTRRWPESYKELRIWLKPVLVTPVASNSPVRIADAGGSSEALLGLCRFFGAIAQRQTTKRRCTSVGLVCNSEKYLARPEWVTLLSNLLIRARSQRTGHVLSKQRDPQAIYRSEYDS